jgi:hypothetical protein
VHLVEAGTDRTGQPRKAARANTHLDFKVLTRETNGALFIMENRNMVRGGPSRHIHYEQEEWFYFVEGSDEVLMEVGEAKLRLKPGDSVWHREMSRMYGLISASSQGGCYSPSHPQPRLRVSSRKLATRMPRSMTPIASRHGMKVVGPPLLDS